MQVGLLLRVLRKRAWLAVAVFLLCVLAGVAAVLLTPREYESSAQIFVSTASASDPSQLAQGNTFTQARVQSYTNVATTPDVLDPVIKELGLPGSAAQLAGRITADAPLDKVIINIHVTDSSSTRSAQIANAVAEQFTKVVENLEAAPDGTVSPVKLTVTLPALTPDTPVSPNVTVDIGLGVLGGLVLGLAAAFAREFTDNTVKSAEELQIESGAPVLGIVPLDKRINNDAGDIIALRNDSRGRRAEAFRQMRTNLQFIDVDDPPRVIAITSALPSEGKTHAAINLAAVLAEAGQRVCLIEADLRRPTIARVLGLVAGVGLTTILIGEAEIEEVLQNAGHNLAVMTSGELPPNPTELLLTDQFRSAIRHISSSVDTVVLDTAPLLPVADGAEVAAIADATILVARANRTTREQVRRATQQLKQVGVVPTGTVLSMVNTSRQGDGGYGYGYGYGYSQRVDSDNESSESTRRRKVREGAE